MEKLVIDWIARYGTEALFGLLVLGIFGLPVPNETLVVFAGALIRKGDLRFVPTLWAAWFGNVVGITLSYAVGRFAGIALVVRYGHVFHLSGGTLDRVNRWFTHSGKWALAFGYFVPGVRHVTAIVAGSSRLALPVFAIFAYGGALIWSLTFIALGYYVGDHWQAVVEDVRRHLSFVLIGILVVLGAYGLIRGLRRGRRGPAE